MDFKWTPCSERLPEHKTPESREGFKIKYLVTLTTGTVCITTWKFHLIGNIGNEYKGAWHWSHQYRDVITAWMPLPEPYEPDEEEVEK